MTAAVPESAAAAEERFLAELRERVAWQADVAARLREEAAAPPPEVDALDANALARLIDAHPDSTRHAEWSVFLGELRYLAGDDGRLPASLERLVRVVLGDLLER